MQWFRMYSDILNDPKVQTLDPIAFKMWVNCLCLAGQIGSRDGIIGTLETVSFAFRETLGTVSSAFHTLMARDLIVTDGETFQIPEWRKRQYKSDTSTDRVKRFRKRHETVSETAPDTESDTEQSQIQKDNPPLGSFADNETLQQPEIQFSDPSQPKPKANGHDKPKRSRKPATHVSDEFTPDIAGLSLVADLGIDLEPTIREFIDYWKSVGKPMCDWQAAFRNRVRQLAKYRQERAERQTSGRSNARDVTGAALRAREIRQRREG